MAEKCPDCQAPNSPTDDHDYQQCVSNLVKQRNDAYRFVDERVRKRTANLNAWQEQAAKERGRCEKANKALQSARHDVEALLRIARSLGNAADVPAYVEIKARWSALPFDDDAAINALIEKAGAK